jgi:hypothetical protein
LILAALALFGCSQPKQTSPVTKKAEPPTAHIIEGKTGTTVYRGSKDEVLWTASWDRGEIRLPPTGAKTGTFGSTTNVSGAIYERGKISCLYKADQSFAVNAPRKKTLVMTNHVSVDSADPKGTLLCDKLVYDGIKKFFIATGHVQVLGTLGAKGTLDEVWANPDLTEIASPELFEKPMKSLLLASLTLLGGAANAQWTDHKGLVANAKQYKALIPKEQTGQAHLLLIKDVSVQSEPQGLNLAADRMLLNASPDPKVAKAYLISDATAVGHVVVVKSVSGTAGKQSTRIEGTKADYASGTQESVIKMAGPMGIKSLDERAEPTMVATAHSGVAYLEPLKKTNLDNSLRKATLEGDVHLVLTQVDPKTKKKTTVRTRSDHMLMESQPNGQKVTLTGSVDLAEDSFGELTGIKYAVFFIGKNGSFQLETSEAK